jgi:hypothetical protein
MRYLFSLACVAAALAVGPLQQSLGDAALPPVAANPAEKPAPIDWKEDPVCRMVFFAVLEGLYTDGVPDDIVDSIVPRKVKEGANPLKTSFVVQCPLCHPVYEAFSQYQRRQAFNDDVKRSTFGKGIDKELAEQLMSTTPMVRLTALRVLVHRWVERRMTSMRLTETEKRDWIAKLTERSNQGKGFLGALMSKDPNYKGWSMYWGCAACNGVTDASNDLTRPK